MAKAYGNITFRQPNLKNPSLCAPKEDIVFVFLNVLKICRATS